MPDETYSKSENMSRNCPSVSKGKNVLCSHLHLVLVSIFLNGPAESKLIKVTQKVASVDHKCVTFSKGGSDLEKLEKCSAKY